MNSLATRLREFELLKGHRRKLGYRWRCDRPDCDGLPHEGWLHKHARGQQHPPHGRWRIWLILAGRGFGKTRTGSETAKEWGKEAGQQIGVVAPKFREARNVCFEGRAGLLNVIPEADMLGGSRAIAYSRGEVTLTLRNLTVYRAFSSTQPEVPRGYALDAVWVDEYAMYREKDARPLWTNLQFALRESANPRVIVTTTPKPVKHIRKLVDRAKKGQGVRITKGRTADNRANLGREAMEELETEYAGTRIGRQELEGELLDDVEGALWQLGWIEDNRLLPRDIVGLAVARTVVAVDPSGSDGAESDEAGIVGASCDHHGVAYVTHDKSGRMTPEEWGRAACMLAIDIDADAIVFEDNYGGEMGGTIIRQAWQQLVRDRMTGRRIMPSVYRVNAKQGKKLRAAPIAQRYQQGGRVHHVGSFPLLEDQMTQWVPDETKDSPDRVDALVYALTDLEINGPVYIRPKRAGGDERLKGRR